MPGVLDTIFIRTLKKVLIVIIALGLTVFGYCQYHRAENYKQQLQEKEVIYDSNNR